MDLQASARTVGTAMRDPSRLPPPTGSCRTVRPTVTLYTDVRNPASNRCYAGIGFLPYCDSWHYPPAAAFAR